LHVENPKYRNTRFKLLKRYLKHKISRKKFTYKFFSVAQKAKIACRRHKFSCAKTWQTLQAWHGMANFTIGQI
jgi:hypothetical protein